MATACPAGVNCSADLGPSVAPIVTPVFILAILAVIARLYCRHITGHNGTPSDYTIIIGLLFSASLTGMVLWSPRLGMGKHVEVVPLEQLEGLLISLYVGCILYAIVIAVIKISILLLYRSLFPTPGIDLATKIIGAISIAWGIETALVGVFSCQPIDAFWDIEIKQRTCINTTAFFIANSTVHVLLDIAILVLPVKKVWALKMSLRHKIVVSFMFLLGGFICVIGIIRLFFVATLDMTDPTYSLYDTYIWSSIEANVGVICACLPTLRPLFIKLLPKGGLGTRNTTAGAAGLNANGTPMYFGYGSKNSQNHNTVIENNRSRLQRNADNFERLHDEGEDSGNDCALGAMGLSPSINSKTAIVITHEVEQEREVGVMPLRGKEEEMGWGRGRR